MKTDLDHKLVEAFPIFYRNRYSDPESTAMCWGFSCDDGWFQIIWDASEKLEAIARTQSPPKDGEEDERLCATQIKQKFGGLRIYTNQYSDEIDTIITEAEKQASVTCEICGEPGTLRQKNLWLSTKCDKHA